MKSLMNYHDTYTHIKRRPTSNSESQHSNGVREVEDVPPFLHFSVLVDSDIEGIIDMWNRKSSIRCCLGQNLYILLVFSLRLPYAVYSLC